MSTIGERIRTRREELGMSQDELAERMGYKSRSTIAKIEKGVNDVVQSNVVKFSKVLNVSIAYLMGWDEEPAKEMHKKNDNLSDIVIRARRDEDFLSVIESVYNLDNEKLSALKQMLAFLK